jgi:hypothetical protein
MVSTEVICLTANADSCHSVKEVTPDFSTEGMGSVSESIRMQESYELARNDTQVSQLVQAVGSMPVAQSVRVAA